MSYLERLKQIPQPGQQPDWPVPPSLPGQHISKSRILATLRLQQLKDLARAYGVDIDPNGTRETVLPIMEAAEARGTFQGPPKNPWYFEKARFNPDQVKEAKSRGGYLRDGRPVTVLFSWKGPDPEADLEEKRQAEKEKMEFRGAAKAHSRQINNEMQQLRRRLKELGISWGKGYKSKAWMIEQIAIAEGKKTAEPE